MTERETLYRGLSNAAWAYLFLYLDVNLGTVSILPSFVGYVLFWQAIGLLEGEARDLGLLRNLCLLLGAWEGAGWAISWAGLSLDALAYPLTLVADVAGLYFHFQFITDLAGLARRLQGPEDRLDRRLLRLRTVQALLTTALAVLLVLPLREGEAAYYLFLGGVLVNAVVGFCLMAGVFRLRKCLEAEAA